MVINSISFIMYTVRIILITRLFGFFYTRSVYPDTKVCGIWKPTKFYYFIPTSSYKMSILKRKLVYIQLYCFIFFFRRPGLKFPPNWYLTKISFPPNSFKMCPQKIWWGNFRHTTPFLHPWFTYYLWIYPHYNNVRIQINFIYCITISLYKL